MSRLSSRLSEISEVCQRTGILTVSDRHTLKQAILDESLEVRDRLVIDRLLQAIRQGSLKLGFYSLSPSPAVQTQHSALSTKLSRFVLHPIKNCSSG